MQSLRQSLRSGSFSHFRTFTTSNKLELIQKWRSERGLPLNPNANGLLTDGPDYTFSDGRLTPYGEGQKKRILKQQQIKENIIELSGEIDFAVDRHKQILEAEENKKKEILSKKLKPKGMALLKSKS
ncbi:unnamed protein product [Psylliodes chrysocephalus]|uniref:Large ribosomal subunit protein mL52 n=1 Tax=Psylliodes chrysocephalus TaxID=3402493 RepID=A0A9P0CTS0_9CUCU|nr:unnamed protein product [Psylliodes chrysocephala]